MRRSEQVKKLRCPLGRTVVYGEANVEFGGKVKGKRLGMRRKILRLYGLGEKKPCPRGGVGQGRWSNLEITLLVGQDRGIDTLSTICLMGVYRDSIFAGLESGL